jgi:hypothetical protein
MLHNKNKIIGGLKKLGAAMGFTFIILSAIGAFVAPLVVFYGAYKGNIPVNLDMTAWGSFGDYISGISGTWISFITLIMVWVTFIWQRQELQDQKELNSRQTTVMEQQSFEQTFFAWLQSIQDIPPAGKIDLAAQVYVNRISQEITQYLSYCLMNMADENFEGTKSAMADQINSSYGGNYKTIVNEGKDYLWLDTYSYALLEFLRFIHTNKIYPDTDTKKSQYVSILISHLNDGARILLGAFAISKNDNASLELLRHYQFFNRLTGQESIDRLLKRFSGIDLS